MNNCKISVVIELILFALLAVLRKKQKPIRWIKGNPEVKRQTLITIGLHIISYAIFVVNNYTIAAMGIPSDATVIKLISAIYVVFILCLLWQQVKEFGRQLTIPITKDNMPPYLSIVCMVWTALFVMLTTVNYVSYTLFPTWYQIEQEGLSFFEIAFEFVYYTFSLMITYSNNSIVAISVGSKTIQIAEMLFFFIVVGNLISQVINRVADIVQEPEPSKKTTTAKKAKRKK